MEEIIFKSFNTVKTALCISFSGFLALAALGVSPAYAVDKKAPPSCAAGVPPAFAYLSEAKGASHYKTGDQGVAAISCLDGDADDIEATYQDLPKGLAKEKAVEDGIYYEVPSPGVATRTYLARSKVPGRLLQVSWVYPEGKLPSEAVTRTQFATIKGR